MIRVYIVDDHAVVVEGIYALLQHEKDIEVVGFAHNAANCLAFFQNKMADVILMDISMPDMNGIELCAIIKKKYPGIMVLALSTFNQSSYIQKMLENGASGYLLKNTGKEEILQAIYTVKEGKQYLSFEVAKIVQAAKHTPKDEPSLTKREKEILIHLANGFTNTQIADMLFISLDTVESHRKNVYTKLKINNIVHLVRYAMEHKYIE